MQTARRCLDRGAEPVKGRAGEVNERDLLREREVLCILAESLRREKRVDVAIALPQALHRVGEEVLVNVVDDPMSVADRGKSDPAGRELCFQKQPNGQRKRRRERELPKHVYLMHRTSAPDAQAVTSHRQFFGILACVNKQAVPGVAQQPGKRLFQ